MSREDDKSMLAEADSYLAWEKDKPVILRKCEEVESGPLKNIPQHFIDWCTKHSDVMALQWEEGDNNWTGVTYKEYHAHVLSFAKSLIKLDVKRFDSVCVIAYNCAHWMFAFHGTLMAGAINVGVYESSSPETIKHIFTDCGAVMVVVDTQTQLDKIISVWDEIPTLRCVVASRFEPKKFGDRNVITWDSFIELGKDVPTEKVNERIACQMVNTCAVLIYTSGTTGVSKGVMISHHNIHMMCRISGESCPEFLSPGIQNHTVSYLPLSHAASQSFDLVSGPSQGFTIHFARRDALKGSLPNTLKHVKPTLMLGVPRVYEKIRDKIVSTLKSQSSIVQAMVNGAMHLVRTSGSVGMKSKSLQYSLGSVITGKILAEIGFERVTGGIIGAAPVDSELMNFLRGLGLNICESYGLSEVFGPISGNLPDNRVEGTSGTLFKGAKLEKLPIPDREDDFEICLDSPTLFMGYLNDEKKTKASFTKNNYFCTGDMGRVTESGHLYITGRIKELIITAGGENIAPIPIEEKLVHKLPFVSNVMVVGDKRPFLSVLLTLKTKLDFTTMLPTDELLDDCINDLKALGVSGVNSAHQLISNLPEKLCKYIDSSIKSVNDAAVNNASRVNKYFFVPNDFSIPGGELGPTMKMRRNAIVQKYKKEIDQLYEKAAEERLQTGAGGGELNASSQSVQN